jgi:hypothetical protein
VADMRQRMKSSRYRCIRIRHGPVMIAGPQHGQARQSGPVWFAIPFLLEIFTLYSLSISRRTSVQFFRYSEFRNIPSCRFVPMPGAHEISRAELVSSEYSWQPTWPQQ